mmetsp:Transcript_21857/g.45780  ORF Transcript_21857/g.45780 Transcript_21857/m.45780 type:complete len:205 (-) Transcript_21857:209-823(-)
MHPEGRLHVAIGAVLAFLLIWTIAILIPDNEHGKAVNSDRAFVASKQFGLVVNGTHYVLDANVGRYQANADENVHIIHSATPVKTQRKLKVSPKNTKRTKLQSQPLSRVTPGTNASNSSSSSGQNKSPLFPRWIWYSTMFLMYHAGRFMKKRQKTTCEEDWFIRSGLHNRLMYDEYEDDFLSVDGSMYGTMSRWSGDEIDKFDV